MKYDPQFARRQGHEALWLVLGAAAHHLAGWWAIGAAVLCKLALSVYHEVRYGA